MISLPARVPVDVRDPGGHARRQHLPVGSGPRAGFAHGYQAFFDKFTSGPNVRMPIDLEILAFAPPTKPKGHPTELRASGFEPRRTAHQGKFFTLGQLKAADGRPLANLLKVDAGAFIATGPNGESFLASGAKPGAPAPCYAAVVRDGLRSYPFESNSPHDLDKVFTDDLMGVEFYAATAPAELREASVCGALVIWNR